LTIYVWSVSGGVPATPDGAALTGINPGARAARTLGAVNPSAPPEVLRTAASGLLLSAAAAQALLDAARRLQAAARAGQAARPLLAGKNLAVLQPPGGVASVLHEAAADLGLRVSQVSLGEPPPAASEFARIARMLGQLYDAIDAGTTPPSAAAELATHAGVPVYRGLADGSHPALALAAGLGTPDDSGGDAMTGDAACRRFMLQALLLATIG
jgi:ornithine carbamoyltransferase